jgi:hypothetical protein
MPVNYFQFFELIVAQILVLSADAIYCILFEYSAGGMITRIFLQNEYRSKV